VSIAVAGRTRAGRAGWLDRTLSIVTDVRPGEGATALLLALNVFLLFAFYYVLKTVRESLILTEGGAEVKSYAAAGQAALLLLFVPAYGMLASRVNRIRLISWVSLFFASHLLLFYAAGVAGMRIGVPFFLWIGIFNLVAVAQFWSFANDIYDEERGKRLLPLVGIGSQLGAWFGSAGASVVFAAVGAYRLLVVCAIGLAATVALTQWIDRRERRGHGTTAPVPVPPPMDRVGGFRLVLSQRYLLLIALLVLLLNVVNSVGEFVLGRLVAENAAAAVAAGTAGGLDQGTLIGQFYGRFFGWVNLAGLVFQMFLVSRLFKWIGVRGTLFVLPVVASLTYGMIAVLPILAIVGVVKVFENSTDYSINNTAKHALFLPTSREAKYKAKQAIDAFFFRAGDLLQAGIVFAGVQLAFDIRGFALVNLAVIVIWLIVVVLIGREHRRLTA
jgi:ATP:ADP antiporter, AAA family